LSRLIFCAATVLEADSGKLIVVVVVVVVVVIVVVAAAAAAAAAASAGGADGGGSAYESDGCIGSSRGGTEGEWRQREGGGRS
jgi:pectate lyase